MGLGNTDNTSDANKPVLTAQQTALNTKANLTDFNSHISADNPQGLDYIDVGANPSDLPSGAVSSHELANDHSKLHNQNSDTTHIAFSDL